MIYAVLKGSMPDKVELVTNNISTGTPIVTVGLGMTEKDALTDALSMLRNLEEQVKDDIFERSDYA